MTNNTYRETHVMLARVQGTLIVFWKGTGVLYWMGMGTAWDTGWDRRLKPGLEVLREALGAA